MRSYFDSRTGRCLYCRGTGDCPRCQGTGELGDYDCPTCKGDGECPICDGEGEIDPFRLRRTLDLGFRQKITNPISSPLDIQMEILTNPDSFRGRCVEELLNSDLPRNYMQALIELLPQRITADQYRHVRAYVRSSSRLSYREIQDNVLGVFYPWWLRKIIALNPDLARRLHELLTMFLR